MTYAPTTPPSTLDWHNLVLEVKWFDDSGTLVTFNQDYASFFDAPTGIMEEFAGEAAAVLVRGFNPVGDETISPARIYSVTQHNYSVPYDTSPH